MNDLAISSHEITDQCEGPANKGIKAILRFSTLDLIVNRWQEYCHFQFDSVHLRREGGSIAACLPCTVMVAAAIRTKQM